MFALAFNRYIKSSISLVFTGVEVIMSSYFPGRGLKKPTNMLETPIFPDIKKGPPRFIWTKKHWVVDPGRTMTEVEHVPQLQEAAVLYQSYDYNSQHAYGKRPNYTAFVNKEFRPPLIERDDIMPLSRIPRPVAIPRINPGGAHASGNNAFADQNIDIPQVEKYLTNRVKEGQIQPTFFCPMDSPVDNSTLPDLKNKLPSYSAGAGFKFPTVGEINSYQDLNYTKGYKKFHPETDAGLTPVTIDAPNSSGMEGMILEYNNPQISDVAGINNFGSNMIGLDTSSSNIELNYTKPQTSAWAGINSIRTFDQQRDDLSLEYKRPTYSVSSGRNTFAPTTLTPVEFDLDEKIEGKVPKDAGMNMTHIIAWSPEQADSKIDKNKVYDVKPDVSYIVPRNTRYTTHNELESAEPKFRQKVNALSQYQPQVHQSYIPRSGISTPDLKLKIRKDA